MKVIETIVNVLVCIAPIIASISLLFIYNKRNNIK